MAAGKTVIRKSKYLAIQGKRQVKGISHEQIKLDQQFDGLKGYFTNRDNPSPISDIITQYHQLWRVERAFRMSKHDLKERPVFHSQPDRIKAHLLLCFVSLLVMRETEEQLKTINYSLKQTIELLGKIGRGTVRIGTVELATESELDPATQVIYQLFAGH